MHICHFSAVFTVHEKRQSIFLRKGLFYLAIVLQIIRLFGGLGMFLFGMHTMSTGLERAVGNKMQKIMEKVTGNLLKSVVLGAVVAALTQSSSATTVMVVGFVNAGILNLNQAVGIIMGANIGTTITAWILSLNDIPGGVWYLDLIKPTTLAPLALVCGAFMLLFCKSKKKTVIGEFIIGLGVLFIGMEYMSDSMDVVFNQVPSLQSLFAADSNPFVGVLIGAGVTAVIQSSAASVGMLQAIASTGTLTFNAAFPIIMGQNIGTCVTALLSSVGANRNAKRTAMIHLYFNVIGTVIFMLGFYAIHFTIGLPFWQSVIRATDISIFHSFFNVVTTLMLLPFPGSWSGLPTRPSGITTISMRSPLPCWTPGSCLRRPLPFPTPKRPWWICARWPCRMLSTAGPC